MNGNRIRLNGGFHNDVFYIAEENKVQRISGKEKSKEMVQQEIEWMDFLYKKGVAVPKPVMKIEVEEDKVITYFEFIEGEQVDVTNPHHWNIKIFEQFGERLGRMHALSKEFNVDEVHRQRWSVENPDVFDIRKKLDLNMRRIHDTLMEELYSYQMTPDTYGLIHNDYHQGNLLISKEGKVTAIDFDECSINWFAQDIAVFFYHAYWQHDSFNGDTEQFCHEFLHSFFEGYQRENSLHKDTIKQIPVYLKLRELFLYQLFLDKWDMANLEDWQRYTLHDLENRIKNRVPYGGIVDFSIYL